MEKNNVVRKAWFGRQAQGLELSPSMYLQCILSE